MTDLPRTFAALSDATRFAIVERLLRQGPLHAGALSDVADVSAPAISRHLRVLREAGILEQRVEGQRRIYSVAPSSIRAIRDWTMDHREFWQGSLDRLAAELGRDGRAR